MLGGGGGGRGECVCVCGRARARAMYVSDSQRTKLCSVFHLTLFYNLVIIYSQCALLWHIHGERERGGEREREFAFVYNICMCTRSSVRTCVLCRSMRVNVFVKL